MEENSFLVTEKPGRLMRKYAVPNVISLLVAALYNIVDQIFIANADYLGSFGNAANTVVYPMTVVALAVAVMIGDGCCAFVSICLGAGDREKGSRAVGNAVGLSVVCGIVITAVYIIFMDGILTAFGGRVNEQTFACGKEYFFWITLGIPFYVFGQAVNPLIRADGSPKFAMVSTLIGAGINIVLDPVFIFVFRWGMMGAAVATVLGQVATAVLSIWYLRRMKVLRLDGSCFRPEWRLMGRFLLMGLCSFLAQISLVAAMAAIQNMVVKYGARDEVFGQAQYAQIPMAVLGIVMKFFQIVISVAVGMSAGCIPVVGYNVGARRPDRAKEFFTRLLAALTGLGVVAFMIVMCLPRQIIGIFGAGSESVYYTEFAVKSMRTYLCMIILACVNKGTFIFIQSLGKAWVSTGLSMLREVVLGVGLALLLPRFFGLDGVLYSMPAADVLTFAASLCVIIITYRSFNRDIKAMQA